MRYDLCPQDTGRIWGSGAEEGCGLLLGRVHIGRGQPRGGKASLGNKKSGLTEAEVLGWKEGWPRKSLEGRISKFGGGVGEHPWAVPELLFCWLLAPTGVISDRPQLQPGALSAFSDQ